MTACHDTPVVADLVRSVGVEPHHSSNVVFASSLAGREFARWR